MAVTLLKKYSFNTLWYQNYHCQSTFKEARRQNFIRGIFYANNKLAFLEASPNFFRNCITGHKRLKSFPENFMRKGICFPIIKETIILKVCYFERVECSVWKKICQFSCTSGQRTGPVITPACHSDTHYFALHIARREVQSISYGFLCIHSPMFIAI